MARGSTMTRRRTREKGKLLLTRMGSILKEKERERRFSGDSWLNVVSPFLRRSFETFPVDGKRTPPGAKLRGGISAELRHRGDVPSKRRFYRDAPPRPPRVGCLSAAAPYGTLQRHHRRLHPNESPMPFGSSPFRDSGLRSDCSGRNCLQCLSAAAPFGTTNSLPADIRPFDLSPMPFGSSPFRDAWKWRELGATAASLQCLSAAAPFGTPTGQRRLSQ